MLGFLLLALDDACRLTLPLQIILLFGIRTSDLFYTLCSCEATIVLLNHELAAMSVAVMKLVLKAIILVSGGRDGAGASSNGTGGAGAVMQGQIYMLQGPGL